MFSLKHKKSDSPLAGATVFVGNALAGVIRNLWTFVVIFCGHFTGGVHLFPADAVAGEARGHWYLRQVLGSSNSAVAASFT